MKKKLLLGALALSMLLIPLLYGTNNIGIKASNIEKDIRSSQKIADDWSVDGMVSDTMAAYISYPESRNDHTFSVYVDRSGISFGYFFRGGGDISEVENYIAEFTIEGCDERAWISMNRQKIDKLHIDNGNDLQVIDIDETKPFALVIPVNAGICTFFDIHGNVVGALPHPL